MGPTDKVLSRVRKLLALAESPNVHEAASAAARAQELISQHRLEAVLEAEDAAATRDAADPIGQETLETSKRLRRWKTVLAGGLARANGCIAFTRSAGGRNVALVLAGRTSDREAFHALWEWLVTTLTWLSASHGGGKGKRWHDDFRVGAALEVVQRLEAAARPEAGSIPAEALVRARTALAAQEARMEQYARAELDLRPGRSLRVDPNAYAAGRAAGSTLDLG